MQRALVALATLLLCAGCVTAPGVPPPAVQSRIADANARGAALVRAGDDAGAVRHYEEALRLARSVEDADAIAAGAINLSIVQQRLGRDAAAREILAVVLDEKYLSFSEQRRAQAELRRAILDLASRDAGGATAWAQRAHERCERLACNLAAAILNVRALLALDAGRPEEGARLAQSAGEAARARGDRAEAANALRTAGRARVALGDPAGAIPPLVEALALDRELADPRKILVDLVELGQASLAKGDRDAARAYFERALTVGRTARDARSVEDIGARLRLLEGR
jgi:tetratricopeptide (TPR) repeat protein